MNLIICNYGQLCTITNNDILAFTILLNGLTRLNCQLFWILMTPGI